MHFFYNVSHWLKYNLIPGIPFVKSQSKAAAPKNIDKFYFILAIVATRPFPSFRKFLQEIAEGSRLIQKWTFCLKDLAFRHFRKKTCGEVE